MAGTLGLYQRWGQVKPPVGTPLDPSHPLTQGLLAYWPLGDGGQGRQDARGRYPLLFLGAPTPAPGHAGGTAMAYAGTPSETYSVDITTALGGATRASLSAWMYRASTANVVSAGCANSSGNRFYMLWHSDGNVYCSAEGGAGSFPNAALGGTGWHHLLLTFNGTATGLARVALYIDGVPRTLTAGGADPGAALVSAANLNYCSLGFDFSNALYTVGRLEDVGVWLRTLTPAEARTLASEPYSFFAVPGWRRYWAPPAAAAGAYLPYDPWPQLGPILAQ